jgi:amino acid adenylation domain-containing protein
MKKIALLSDARRELLEKYRSGGARSQGPKPTEVRRAPGTPSPLSLGQEQLWIHAQLNPGLPVYNEAVTIGRRGPLDVAVLERSLDEIIRRHEIWRTSFTLLNGVPVQIVQPPVHLEVPLADLRGVPSSRREAEALRLATADARRPFDLSRGPMLRALLTRLDEEEHRLFLTFDQIVFDGVSLHSAILPELKQLYDAFAAGQESPLAELPLQYADFARWQRDRLAGDALRRHLAYWRRQLAAAPALDLPIDRPRPVRHTVNGAQQTFALPRDLSDAIKTLCRREGVTLFVGLFASLTALLHRYTGQEDIVTGTVTTARKRSDAEGLIGFFLNTVMLRADLSGDPSYRDVLARAREVVLGAMSHDDVPMHMVVKELGAERAPGTPPIQVMFILEPPLPEVDGWTVSHIDVDVAISRFDVSFELDDRPDGLVGRIRYNTDLFHPATIVRLREHWHMLLEALVAHPERPISSIPLATGSTGSAAVIRPATPFTVFGRDDIEQSIAARFEQQVRNHPDRIAVETSGRTWTYDDLNRMADDVAGALASESESAARRVALVFEPGGMMVAAMLGVLKAAHVYVPLEPTHPAERLSRMLRDAGVDVIVTDAAHRGLARVLAGSTVAVIDVGEISVASRPHPGHRGRSPSPDDPAYILYTSGSTGEPKGAVQSHRNVLHFIRVYTNNLHISADDTLTLVASCSTDAAVMDIFGALLNGARLCPLDLKQIGFLGLRERLSAGDITIYHSTPTVYRGLLATLGDHERIDGVRMVVLGGEEAVAQDLALYKRHFSNECLFVNGLGPTESTVSVQYFADRHTSLDRRTVPVGFPVEGTEILLLDRSGRPGQVYGEIAIRSAHVALGYWNRPDLDARAFHSDPACGDRRTYRTGDMGRLLPDGTLAFEGRKDRQVKIRGFRVEMAEVEAALLASEAVKEAVVVARTDGRGEQRLIGYVVPHRRHSLEREALREFLLTRLPEHMIPTAFVALDRVPLTASGKVDPRALPEPATSSVPRETLEPRTPTERTLTAVWERVLGVELVGRRDNFFDLGGHSLLAVRLFDEIEKTLGVKYPPATLFLHPTVEQLARMFETPDLPRERSPLVRLRPRGNRLPLFLVHGFGGEVLGFEPLLRRLHPDQPVYGLQAAGPHYPAGSPLAIESMAASYVDAICRVQPGGRFLLGAYSSGGPVAYEIALQLLDRGHEVALLAIIDGGAPVAVRHRVPWSPREAVRFVKNLAFWIVDDLLKTATADLAGRVRSRVRLISVGLAGRNPRAPAIRRRADVRDRLGLWQAPDSYVSWLEAFEKALVSYQPRAYPGRITLLRARTLAVMTRQPADKWWGGLAAGGVDLRVIKGDHATILREPRVQLLADEVAKVLAAAQSVEDDAVAHRRRHGVGRDGRSTTASPGSNEPCLPIVSGF